MKLEYLEGWDTIKRRLAMLWQGEVLDRCCISVTAPKNPADPYVPSPPTTAQALERWYTDPALLLRRGLEKIEKTHYAGDALPYIFPYFGSGGHAKYLGGSVTYRPDTIWIRQAFDDYGAFSFEMEPGNAVFRREVDAVRFLARQGQGRFFVTPVDNCGSFDGLAQLRGDAALMMDLLDEPEAVQRALAGLVKVLNQTNAAFFDALRENNDGGTVHGWLNLWSPGRMMQLQCDLAVMLSPADFERFILPELEASADALDNAVYHMDGVEQIRHLDLLLSVRGIGMIQWAQVVGQPPATQFLPQLKKIQAAGKGLVLILYKHQLKDIVANLSPRGLNLIVRDAATPAEADEIVEYVAKQTAAR